MAAYQQRMGGRHSTSRNNDVVDQVLTLVMQNHHVTIWELVDEMEISISLVHSIFSNDLTIWKVDVKFMRNCKRWSWEKIVWKSCKWQPQVPENYDHWWLWVLDLLVQPRNQGGPVTVGIFIAKPIKARQVCSNIKAILTGSFLP